jgi:D-alanyl-D-alanine carboxypeptidase (penicillin-binding protein 5/6)
MELIAVVMGSATSQERFAACKSMLDYGFANFALYTPALQEGAAVAVELGKGKTVNAVPADAAALLVEKGKLSGITARAELSGEVDAPVSRGDRVGTVFVECDGQVLAELALTAGEDVAKLTWADLFAKLLGRIALGGQNS